MKLEDFIGEKRGNGEKRAGSEFGVNEGVSAGGSLKILVAT